MRALTVLACVLLPAASGLAQPVTRTNANVERARAHYMAGWEHMQSEDFERAAAEFQLATDFDEKFAMAWYGLGRAHMALRRYQQAALNLTMCRDLYSAQASRKFNGQMDAQRSRQDRLMELQELRNQYSKGPQTNQTRDMLRVIENAMRQTTQVFDREMSVTFENPVPAFVSLSLGSALFRTERFDEAERAYKAAVHADDSAGAAHNNLAVLYLMKGRHRDAMDHIRSAERAGFYVDPDLKSQISARLQ